MFVFLPPSLRSTPSALGIPSRSDNEGRSEAVAAPGTPGTDKEDDGKGESGEDPVDPGEGFGGVELVAVSAGVDVAVESSAESVGNGCCSSEPVRCSAGRGSAKSSAMDGTQPSASENCLIEKEGD